MRKALFVLYVADQARSREFYRAALDLEPTLDVPGMTEFPLTDGGALGLMPEDGIARLFGAALPHQASAAGVPRAELYLSVDDAAAGYARAVAAGGVALSAPAARDWGHVAGYVRDPDGHVLAFAEEQGANRPS